MSLKSVILLVVICLSFLAIESEGAILTVTTLADTDDGVCDAHCSLREAVSAATVVNTVAATDTVIFARELRGGTIHLTGPLVINKRINIDGPNKRRITLKGNNTFRILETHSFVFLDGLIIRDGSAADGDGGGIFASGYLSLNNVAVLNNTAKRGGGIFVSFNTRLYIADSLIAGNTAIGDMTAGGIDMFRADFHFSNCTVSGNQAISTTDSVGGIRIIDTDGFINNSTVVNNFSGGTSVVSVGGILALGANTRAMSNTIVANNTGGSRPDYYGQLLARYNLVGIADETGGLVNGVNGNIVGSAQKPVDPLLAPLSDNGGGLPAHALLAASPAIDAGSNALADDRRGITLTTDQRGYNRIANATVDIGAYEFNSQPLVINSLITGQITDANGRGVSGALVTLRDASGEIKNALTNPFGFYRLANVPNGSYTVEAKHKSYNFAPQNPLVEESTEYVNFVSAASSFR